jgi:hypothetical protein
MSRFRRRAAALDAMLDELAEVSCSCAHLDHILDIIRFAGAGQVREYRLGPCYAPGCGCRGGRAA